MSMQVQMLGCLLELAVRGADKEFVKVSTGEIGLAIGKSQQTASRLLVLMEKAGLIERQRDGKKQRLMITSSGMDELHGLHQVLSRIFEGYAIEGKLFTGVGEGAYYISQEGYRRQFKEKLGFDPFPGTLNLRVSNSIVEELSSRPGIKIEGFQAGNRSFGGGRCFRTRIGSEPCGAIFLPNRTHYPADVLEVVSPDNLREKLGLRDGDLVCLIVVPYSP